MKRVLVCASILVLALAPVGASAQGLFEGNWSGLGSSAQSLFGGNWSGLGASLMGGAYSCGSCGPKTLGPVFYVGYTSDPGTSTQVAADTRGTQVLGAYSLAQQYGVRGIWLGVSQAIPVNDSFGIIASGWYMLPGEASDSQEPYNYTTAITRLWSSMKVEWWYADALAALGSLNGFALLGGFRYDYFSTNLSSPKNAVGVASLPSDEADVTSKGYIPLIGAQMAYAGSNYNMLLRVIGCPSLIGRVNYSETFAGATNLEASGNYKGSNFIEVFGEYGHRINDRSAMGLFARFSSTRGASNLTAEGNPAAGDEPFDVTIGRNSWTAGGHVTLQF